MNYCISLYATDNTHRTVNIYSGSPCSLGFVTQQVSKQFIGFNCMSSRNRIPDSISLSLKVRYVATIITLAITQLFCNYLTSYIYVSIYENVLRWYHPSLYWLISLTGMYIIVIVQYFVRDSSWYRICSSDTS